MPLSDQEDYYNEAEVYSHVEDNCTNNEEYTDLCIGDRDAEDSM